MSLLPFLKNFKSITLKHNFHTVKCTHFKCTVEGIWAVVYICVTSTPVESRSPVASPPLPATKVSCLPSQHRLSIILLKGMTQEVVSVIISVITLLISCSSPVQILHRPIPVCFPVHHQQKFGSRIFILYTIQETQRKKETLNMVLLFA